MTDALHDLLKPRIPTSPESTPLPPEISTKYLSRLISLRLSDLTTTEPESLKQAAQSNLVSLQQLSSRSHRTTSASATHLATLQSSLPTLQSSTAALRQQIPSLDAASLTFAQSYSRSNESANATLSSRKQSALVARQADRIADILELPGLLSATIAAASQSSASNASYSQALDLLAHIKRLAILYPDSALIASVVRDAELAMRAMTTSLVASLRTQNLRLAAAIRTIGWLRRVAPDLAVQGTPATPATSSFTTAAAAQGEEHFGALFLAARLATFLAMTEALAPLRDLADQETQIRLSQRRASQGSPAVLQGQQTERYLKRYVEIFREQSFSAISNYVNMFPREDQHEAAPDEPLRLPSALASFPLQLVGMLEETLQTYLPNIGDPAAREALLMQVLYAAGSLGRLGADFSLMIAGLFEEGAGGDGKGDAVAGLDGKAGTEEGDKGEAEEEKEEEEEKEPEWLAIIKKHRVQSARLEAMAAGQEKEVSVR